MTRFLNHLQERTEVWRRVAFYPFLCIAHHLKLTANHVAAFRLLLAVLFVFLIIDHPTLAWILITFSIYLDAVDGAVARFNQQATDRGKFIDVLSDQLTFALLALGCIRLLPNLALPLAGATTAIIFLYIMAMVNRNENQPSDWLIKAKVQMTWYKAAFIVFVVSYLVEWLGFERTKDFLWYITGIAAIHFAYHYLNFMSREHRS